MSDGPTWCLVGPKAHGEAMRAWLVAEDLLAVDRAVGRDGDEVVWPMTAETTALPHELGGCRQERRELEAREPRRDPHAMLTSAVEQEAATAGLAASVPALLDTLPRRWERLGDLILLPADTARSREWTALLEARGEHLWRAMATALRAERLGRQAEIDPSPKRHSRAELLLGEDGWVDHREGGVVYRFDATTCMFSSGNTTERRRLGAMDASGETVLDCYAGIGYYTLPLLVKAGAAHVHACEWNPDALEGLMSGLLANGVLDRATIHAGDNRRVELDRVADRVVLGLLPHSEEAWPLAVRALKRDGGTLHVHANVPDGDEAAWTQHVLDELEWLSRDLRRELTPTLLHRERVKSYAPRIWHLVADIRLEPA